MRARDRRGPFTALVLLVGYVLLGLTILLWIAQAAELGPDLTISPTVATLIIVNLMAFLWRAALRFGFTAQTHGWAEGIRAVLRIPVTNVVAIMAGRRAITAYAGSLFGRRVVWDKTPHFAHPASRAIMSTLRSANELKLRGGSPL